MSLALIPSKVDICSTQKENSLFKGKEIEYGKDLVGLTRKIDMSEIKTALIAVGPENDKGKRLELVVTDDEAQSQFNLPMRYIWGYMNHNQMIKI